MEASGNERRATKQLLARLFATRHEVESARLRELVLPTPVRNRLTTKLARKFRELLQTEIRILEQDVVG